MGVTRLTYQLYIGSNNVSKRLELAKIERVLAVQHSGFTILPATGYWQGTKERSVTVIIEGLQATILDTISRLKSELAQEAIGYQVVSDIKFA